MESRFSKYRNSGANASNHIANIHSFIDWLHSEGNNIIEDEIKDLTRRIEAGGAPPIFSNKKEELIDLGENIEKVYNTYHFNKDN